MADNYELIAAKDLPTTDAKEVDVLCVENGELKRKAGASIGGGGGGYVINVPVEAFITGAESGSIVLEESYDNFADVLYNGGNVWLDLSEIMMAQIGVSGIIMRVCANAWMFSEGVLIATISQDGSSFEIMFENGTWTPPVELTE